MSDVQINVPVLRKALEHITAHPEEWYQGLWAVRGTCGTAYCLAGTIAVQQGHEILWEHDPEEGEIAGYVASREYIADVAARELGYASSHDLFVATNRGDKLESLFSADNTMRALYQISRRLTNGEIEVPAELPDGS